MDENAKPLCEWTATELAEAARERGTGKIDPLLPAMADKIEELLKRLDQNTTKLKTHTRRISRDKS